MVNRRVLIVEPQALVSVYVIFTLPADMPVIEPLLLPIVAIAVFALDQVPPAMLPVNVTGPPLIDIEPGPTMAGVAGNGFSVIVWLRLQPLVHV